MATALWSMHPFGVKWVIPEPGSDRARSLLAAVASGEAEMAAPGIYIAEVSNIVWKRCRLRQDLSEEDARSAMRGLLGVLPMLVPGEHLAAQAVELALAFHHSAYDCFYVALAIRHGSTLVTADRALVDTFGPATGRVIHLDELPASA